MLPTGANYRERRIAFLEGVQNADGGWGYWAGKQSWLEPTVYSLLALYPGRGPAFTRGWHWMRSLQLVSGAWPVSATVPSPHCVTALAVTLHTVAGVFDAGFRRGVEWLLASAGAERGAWMRVAHFLRPSVVEFDPRLSGWPWQPGTTSWVEPTAHTLMALQRAANGFHDPRLPVRIALGERMLLDRRCRDGGWNYGNRRVLDVDLPSYPESTALALMALAGNPAVDWGSARAWLERTREGSHSPLARAWIGLSLFRLGVRLRPPDGDTGSFEKASGDVLVTALEALAGSGVLV